MFQKPKNSQSYNSSIFGKQDISKEEQNRIANEHKDPIKILNEYHISIPDNVYQNSQNIQDIETTFKNLIKKTACKNKLNRDKRKLISVVDFYKTKLLNNKSTLELAIENIENYNKIFFAKREHIEFYSKYQHLKLEIEDHFNK